MTSPIAIVGIGCRFAGAQDLQAFWELTVTGTDTFAPVPADRWDADAFFDSNARSRDKSYAPTGSWIADIRSFPAVALQVPPRRAEVMDPQQRLALEVALAAVEDSGRTVAEMPRMTGVYIGVTATEYRALSSARLIAQMMASGSFGRVPENAAELAASVENVIATRPYTAPGVLGNMIAATVTQELRLRGPSFTTDAACASSLVAIDSAVKALRDGSIDCALAGGVYLCVTPEHHVAFSRIGAISKQGKCLPFDQRADGFVQGDGAGIVMLKRLAAAERDGDRIYAVLHGIGCNNDGGENGPMAPVKAGQIEVINRAWQDAGVDAGALGYVECHGTGTLVGDHIEFDGLASALGAKVAAGGGKAGLGSSKANFGHTMSAAGVAGVIRAVMAIHHETVPPMAGFESPKPDLQLEGSAFYIPKSAVPWSADKKLATVSSFGFGGTNVHVVVGNVASVVRGNEGGNAVATVVRGNVSAGGEGDGGVGAAQPELVLLSAGDEATLRLLAAKTARAVLADPKATVAGVARVVAKRRRQVARLAVVATTREELAAKLGEFGSGGHPKGVTFGMALLEHAPKVAFLFPGQGAQRIGMLAGVRDRFPVVAAALDAMDVASTGVMGAPVTHYLYPERRGEADAERALAELTETHNTQPALFAVGHALTQLLAAVGVTPVVVAGHSVGEFTAAAAAGVIRPEDGLKWCARRGQGMQAVGGDKGAMAAWVADRATAEKHLVPGGVSPWAADAAVIANVNHPRQVVVSGKTEVVAQANAKARAAGIEVTELRVSHGFHSPVFAALNLDAEVDAIVFSSESRVPVASCIADASYRDGATAAGVFKRHAISPVLWTDALARCKDAGAEVFLQVAAGGPLISFVRGTLPGMPAVSLASKEDGDAGASLLEGLGQLFTLGVDIDVLPITAPADIASVPPTMLPREVYWVVGDRPVDAISLRTKHGVAKPAARTESVSAGAVALAGAGVGTGAGTGAGAGTDPLSDLVFAAVAKASAYPRAALKPTMKLGDDLGFDSMMVADLAEELRKQIPSFVGIPQELLISGPTIADIVAFAKSPAATAQNLVASDDNAPLERYSPTWVPAPLPTWGARELALTAKTFIARGDGLLGISEALVALGLTPVASNADLIIYGAPTAEPLPVSAVLSGEATSPDLAADLIALLDAQAQAKIPCDLIVLRRDDDVWAEALSGVVRAVAREWPERVVKVLRNGHALTSDIILAELTSFDRTADIRYVNGQRFIAGVVSSLAAVAAGVATANETTSAWTPTDRDVIVITGGTRGIGKALGERLAASGAKVILLGRSIPPSDVTELAPVPGIRYIAADVTDRDSLKVALDGLKPTVLVHSAGLLADGALGTVDPQVGHAARSVKVDGLLNAIAACGTSLERVLAIGSWAGRFGNRNQAHYASANALMSALVGALPARMHAVVSEFGPWVDSDMVRSIPEAIQHAMRAEGVDFVGSDAGLTALASDLGNATSGPVVQGRKLPATMKRATRSFELSVASHPFLKDHALPSDKGPVPVFPIASAATTIAETAALGAPFEVTDLTLFQGIAVKAPLTISCHIDGEKAELRQGDKHVLSYRARCRPLAPADLPTTLTAPVAKSGGGAPTLALSAFYGGLTFHGPLLQGITHIDGIGPDFVRGRVKTSRPGDWVRAHDLHGQTHWAIDPLAFDSAMQLAAYVAYVRYGRAGTPVGFARWVQVAPWPAGEVLAEATFAAADSDKLSADLVFRTLAGDVIALAFGVTADMKRVEKDEAVTPTRPAVTPAEVPFEVPFEVKPEWTDPSKWRGYKDLALRLHAVQAMGLKLPYFDLHEGTARNTSIIGGREVINFSSYNYIGLSGDPRVIDEVVTAIHQYGTSVSASRVASGERPFHRALEAELAAAHGSEDALVMAGGHATNVNTIGHLFGAKDLILHDELIHDSCIQGIKLSGAARRGFKHEDMADLERQLKELRRHYEKVLLLAEGVYSMDGDISNLPELVRLKKQYGCMLMVDEAHSFGTIGATGRGVGELFGMDHPDSPARAKYGLVRGDVDIWMGTLSKSLASMGGWVAGRKELILYLRYTTPGFVFAAGIPPALGQAALSSLRYMLAEPERVTRLQANAKRFYTLLKARDIDTDLSVGDSPVIPVITGDSMWALKLSERLLDLGVSPASVAAGETGPGINAKPIIFPAVANDAARLRFFMTSLHTEAQLVYTADAIKRTLDQIRAESPKKPAVSAAAAKSIAKA